MIPSPILALVVALGCAAVMLSPAVGGGNYLACPKDEATGLDYCHDDDGGETGLCMIMSTSPSPYKSRCVRACAG